MRRDVGVVGLGNMGQPIAERLAQSSFRTLVFDTRPEPLAVLEALGGVIAGSMREIAVACDIICVVVNSDAQLENLMIGDGGDGLLNGVRPGTVIAIHSTVSPHLCRRLAALAAERAIDIIDAPVSGAETGARAGTLTLMVGGRTEALEACRPVFETYASNIFHLGDIGTGQIAKIANNLMMLISTHAVREGLRLACAAGVDRSTMIEVAMASTGDSWALRKFEYFIDMADRYPGGLDGFQKSVAKDLGHAVNLAKEYSVDVPAASVVLQNAQAFWKNQL